MPASGAAPRAGARHRRRGRMAPPGNYRPGHTRAARCPSAGGRRAVRSAGKQDRATRARRRLIRKPRERRLAAPQPRARSNREYRREPDKAARDQNRRWAFRNLPAARTRRAREDGVGNGAGRIAAAKFVASRRWLRSAHETATAAAAGAVAGLRLKAIRAVRIAVDPDDGQNDAGGRFGVGVDIFAAARVASLVRKTNDFAHYGPLFRSDAQPFGLLDRRHFAISLAAIKGRARLTLC